MTKSYLIRSEETQPRPLRKLHPAEVVGILKRAGFSSEQQGDRRHPRRSGFSVKKRNSGVVRVTYTDWEDLGFEQQWHRVLKALEDAGLSFAIGNKYNLKFGKEALDRARVTGGVLVFSQNKKVAESLNEGLSDKENAEAALAQLGGAATVKRMLGGRFSVIKGGVAIYWPSRHRSKGNWVEITINPKDYWDVAFFNYSTKGKKLVKTYKDVHASQLIKTFEDQTGWVLRVPRVVRSESQGRLRSFKINKFGLAEEPRGKRVCMDYKGKHLTGKVLDAYHDFVTNAVRFKVQYPDGKPWPIEPVLSAIKVLE